MTVERPKIINIFTKSLLILLLVFFVLIVLAQANPLNILPGRDSGFFLYAGSQILKGKLLYIDVWDSKGPGIFYVNALGLLLAKGSRWGVWFLEFLVAITSTLLGYKIAKTEWGHGAALLAAMLWLFSLNVVLQKGNLTEEYSLLFSFFAIFVFWKITKSSQPQLAGWILLGSLLAVNFLFRANNIGVIVSLMGAFLGTSLLSKQYGKIIKPILGFAAGILIVFGIVTVYFLRLGIFYEMIQASIFYNFSYAGGNFNLIATLERAIELLGWGLLAPFLGFLSVIWHILKKKTLAPLLLFGLINWPVEMVLSSLSGRMYIHYFICWLPAIWLLSAFAYSVFAPKIFSDEMVRLIETAPWLVCVVIAFFGFSLVLNNLGLYWNSFNRLAFQRSAGVEMISPLANYVRQNTRPEDTVLEWGINRAINFLARRDAPTAYVYYPLLVESAFSNRIADNFYQDLIKKKPMYIIDNYARNPDNILSIDPVIRAGQISAGKGQQYTAENITAVFAFIENNYFLEKTIDKALIFKLKK